MKKIITSLMAVLLVLSNLLGSMVSATDVEYSQESMDTWTNVGSSYTYTRYAQKINFSGQYLQGLSFYLKRTGTASSGEAHPYFRVRDSDNDTILGEIDIGDWNVIPTSEAWFSANFTSPIYVTGDVYLGFESTNSIGGVRYHSIKYQNSDVIGSQSMWRYNYGTSVWSEPASTDLAYKYITTASPGGLVVITHSVTRISNSDNLSFYAGVTTVGSSNVTTVGFQVALYAGSYTDNFSQSVNWSVPTNWTQNVDLNLTTGNYYKYRAFAVDSSGIVYGNEDTFTFYGSPQIETISATVSILGQTISALLRGRVTDKGTDGAIITGFDYGTQNGTWIVNPLNSRYSINTTAYFNSIVLPLEANTTYYYRAWAFHATGLYDVYYGYGEVKTFTTGAVVVLPPGTISVTTTASLNPYNGVRTIWSVTLVNNTAYLMSKWRFYWGTSNTTLNSYVEKEPNIGLGYSFDGNPSTTYYGKFSVLINNVWYDSNVASVTTLTAPSPVINNPIVATTNATSVATNSFVANGRIVDLLGHTTTYLQFQFSYVDAATGTTQEFRQTETGNFTVGNYSVTVNELPTDITVSYRFLIYTVTGRYVYGDWVNVILGSGSNQSIDFVPVIGDFKLQLRKIMARLGMDNLLGHWMFLALMEILIIIFFGGFALSAKDELIKKILVFIGALVAIAVFGGFIFSGLLGIWAVAILIIIAVGLIIIIGGRTLTAGRV